MNTLEKITPRSKDFAQWYTDLITAAKLVCYSAIKGETIFRPNGWAI
jgi:prolyl-tRNA synthetase